MKCTGCGLPLSPQRTHCPRCGKAAGEPEVQAQNQGAVPQYVFTSFSEQNNDALQGPTAIATQHYEIDQQSFPSSGVEQSPNQVDQIVLPGLDKTQQSNPEQQIDWQSSSQPKQRSAPSNVARADEFRPFPHSPQRTEQASSKHTLQPGFTIAGLFVVAGAFILLFVYIISFHLPSVSAGNQTSSAIVNTPTSQSLSTGSQGTPLANLTPTSPPVTPTPNLPGKAYIDNAQIGSSLSFNTAQLSLVTTNFAVNQEIFVTFMLHPLNTGGAVCLLWFVNQKQFSQFAFQVGAIPQHAYSFAFAKNAGPGSVSIYWASSTACTDKMLAQTVNFTVTP